MGYIIILWFFFLGRWGENLSLSCARVAKEFHFNPRGGRDTARWLGSWRDCRQLLRKMDIITWQVSLSLSKNGATAMNHEERLHHEPPNSTSTSLRTRQLVQQFFFTKAGLRGRFYECVRQIQEMNTTPPPPRGSWTKTAFSLRGSRFIFIMSCLYRRVAARFLANPTLRHTAPCSETGITIAVGNARPFSRRT